MKMNFNRIVVFALALTCVLPLLFSARVEAAESSYPGNVFKAPITTEDHVVDPKYDKSELVKRKQYYDFALLEASQEVYVVRLVHESEGNNPVKYYSYLFYSVAPFELKEQSHTTNYSPVDGSASDSSSNYYTRTASKDAGSGLYFYEKSSSCALYMNENLKNKTVMPAYTLAECFYNTGVKERLLLSIVNGTFSDQYEFVQGSDSPEYDPNSADYSNNIGYLQDFSTKGILHNQDKNNLYIDYRSAWSRYSDTDFDVTSDNVYVSFYYQVHGTYKYDLTQKKDTITAPRRFIKRVRGSDLYMESSTRDLDEVCKDDRELFPYNKLFYSITREDYAWFRIDVYNDDGSWSYGGWLKYNMATTVATTHIPGDDPNGSDDSKDDNGGYGDGEEIRPETGISDTDDNDWDNTINHDDDIMGNGFDITDFPALLKSMSDSMGDIPALFGKVFSFIPQSFLTALGIFFGIIVAIRILGR